MREMSIDIETFCEVDIKSAGSYKYAEKSEIILFGYSIDKEPPKCIDLLSGEKIPQYVIDAMLSYEFRKTAHNASFELGNISQALGLELVPEQWRCSAVLSAIAGYPMSLDESSKALGTADKKDSEGKALIRYFCIPCKPTKANGGRTRNLPHHAPEKWAKFIEYCKQDVATEQAICDALHWVELPEIEHKLWCLDQRINKRGWKVDIDLANCAIELDAIFRERLTLEAKRLTGLSNPNSVAQLKVWLENQGLILPKTKSTAPVSKASSFDSEDESEGTTSLSKGTIDDLLEKVNAGEMDYVLDDVDAVKRVLEIRQEMSKTSIKKYVAMIKAAGVGDRVRGLFQFCGAGRTWRWAGRLVQVQNLPRILLSLEELMLARQLVKEKDIENIEWVFGSLSNILSQLIRTAFISDKLKRLIISDFSAIEARVLAWIAGEEWVLEVFRTHGKIYEATASKMMHKPIEDVTKQERQKGKIGALLLGYGGGPDALERMGAEKMGLKKKEQPQLVKDWREANPNIVAFWRACEAAAKKAIKFGGLVKVGEKGISFSMKNGTLLLTLPSGRSLMFPKAEVQTYMRKVPIYDTIIDEEGDEITVQIGTKLKEAERITFWAISQFTRKWEKSSTYGGKLVENICQAIARDCLANAMLNLDKVGILICSHVHDEVIAEMPNNVTSLAEVNRLMVKPQPWMEGLPLAAEGGESYCYNK